MPYFLAQHRLPDAFLNRLTFDLGSRGNFNGAEHALESHGDFDGAERDLEPRSYLESRAYYGIDFFWITESSHLKQMNGAPT